MHASVVSTKFWCILTLALSCTTLLRPCILPPYMAMQRPKRVCSTLPSLLGGFTKFKTPLPFPGLFFKEQIGKELFKMVDFVFWIAGSILEYPKHKFDHFTDFRPIHVYNVNECNLNLQQFIDLNVSLYRPRCISYCGLDLDRCSAESTWASLTPLSSCVGRPVGQGCGVGGSLSVRILGGGRLHMHMWESSGEGGEEMNVFHWPVLL